MKPLRSACALCLLLGPGCRPPAPGPSGAPLESQLQMARAEQVDAFLLGGPWFAGPASLATLRRLAPLRSERFGAPEPGRPAAEGRVLAFDGLTLAGFAEGDSFRIRTVIVMDSRWGLLHGLDVGSPAARIPAALGQPLQAMEGPSHSFSGERGTVRFDLQGGRITQVECTLLF